MLWGEGQKLEEPIFWVLLGTVAREQYTLLTLLPSFIQVNLHSILLPQNLSPTPPPPAVIQWVIWIHQVVLCPGGVQQ